jgi:hypothetical protein
MHTAYTCIVGSNPTVSAKIDEKSHREVAFFFGASVAHFSAASGQWWSTVSVSVHPPSPTFRDILS